jgi:hypothetical protein
MLRLPAGEIYDVGAVELDKMDGLVELPLQRGQQRPADRTIGSWSR